MKRLILLLAPVLLFGLLLMITSPAAAAESISVTLRIEGMDKLLYYNTALGVTSGGGTTIRDVIASYNALSEAPAVTVSENEDAAHISAVGQLRENSAGSLFNDLWMIRLNGQKTDADLDRIPVKTGDDIVVYYADPSLIQYPEPDLTRMLTDGIVKFTSLDEMPGDAGVSSLVRNPVAGAAVEWDGMKYITDANGDIIIDSTGAGVRHAVSIERYYQGSLPTVLRFAPGHTVIYGYHDVSAADWFSDAVLFVSERHILNGVTDTEFAPKLLVNKAMFLTILGRLAGAEVDPSADAGFSDAPRDGWSAGYIQWALQNGIAKGNPDGTFGQHQVLTREQIAVMLYRYTALQGSDISAAEDALSGFSDAGAVSPYAVRALQWAVTHGIMTGSSGHINPLGAATRSQTAVVLQRFITMLMPSS